ncbi:MAG: cobyric acid synthase CobQ, partial [Lachnospiraceae bacterium]|nr:cobyric acid synthase CobQ [Lachnospiraceae bacterium]
MCDSKELTTCGGCFAQLAAGCYIHGIFDSSDVSGRLINVLFHNKGLTYKGKIIDRKDYREEQINL